MINHVTRLGNVGIGGKNPVRIMGILNTSQESFYKKSIKITKQQITNTIKQMEIEGADFIDVGGMSTAPYLSTIISERLESQRILKAINIIQNVSNLPISVDTCRANVAKSALEQGIEIINDISGLKYDDKMIDVIRKYQPSLVICAFSSKKIEGDIQSTKNLLQESLNLAKTAGIPSSKIVLDPSIGFFRKSGRGSFFTKIKSDWLKRDLSIIQNLKLISQQHPILISVSNKSFIGKILGKESVSDRLFGSIATEAICVLNGADIIRTHNVEQTKDAILVAEKLSRSHKGL
jgi:dihydropteroate synthase